jgi:uncharacterized membrane protein YhaH (DUF805 family)
MKEDKHMQNIFSGRYNRAKYIKMTLLVSLPIAVVAVLASELASAGNFFFSAINLVAFVALSPITIKRLHDVNMPDWCYVLFLVPGANIILGLYLLFKKGARGTNKYGPDPLSSI